MASESPKRQWITGGGVHELLPDRILGAGRYLIEQEGPERWRILEGRELEDAAEEMAAEHLDMNVEAFRAQRARGEVEQAEAAQFDLLPQQLRLARQLVETTTMSLPLAIQHVAREQGVTLSPEAQAAIIALYQPAPTPSVARGKKSPPATLGEPIAVPVVESPAPEPDSQQ